MTAGDRQEAAREQLEDALRATDPATKDYHIREALQFLSLADDADLDTVGEADESGK